MKHSTKSFLGTGWSYPPAFDRLRRGARMSSDMDDIEESIRIIIGTIPGERIMRPEFGCNIKRLVFEHSATAFLSKLDHEVGLALLNFEPRIKFTGAQIVQRNELTGFVQVRIDYILIITNTRHNMVFPFYLIEGTNVSI